ncbi:MAG TPA: protein translocase subunit SecD [Candidatus Binatia bacterium]|nr:protein translocase subunit SecD [Candidatus Binatia bacterium]
MDRGLLWRLMTIAVSVVIGLIALVPSFVDTLPQWWKNALPSDPIPLGLDLRGGIHLVLEVQTEKAVENSIDRTIEDLRRAAREAEIATKDWKREGRDSLIFSVVGEGKVAEMEKLVTDRYGVLQPSGGTGTSLRYTLHPQAIEEVKTMAVDQALETIRNRVDQFGVAEPTIQRQGEDSILVQLPGVQDPERAKSLIGRTAQLQFQLVADDPKKPGVVRAMGSEVDPVTRRATEETYYLEPTILMSGEVIADARHRPGEMGEAPYVAVTLNGPGADLFERITGDNTGRLLAIVLDGKVQSAPRINERIGGGRAVITGNFSLDEARDLSIVLRAGALPAPVVIAEERTVGPSLGQDSIRAGIRSFVLGGALTILSMILYYRIAGGVADLALLFNVILLLACLALFRGVLTLPGIAGIVLTIGMAVDANVLINERIREELRAGRGPHAALEAGYSRALPAIIDSNATTFLAGIILFQFGSGPVKGFALTLCIGILTTMYTAVFCSRAIHELVAYLRPRAAVSI